MVSQRALHDRSKPRAAFQHSQRLEVWATNMSSILFGDTMVLNKEKDYILLLGKKQLDNDAYYLTRFTTKNSLLILALRPIRVILGTVKGVM